MMQLFIHTYGRVDRQITLQSFSRKLLSRTFLVIQDREVKEWKIGDVRCEVLILPKHIQTLSPSRQWIMEYAVAKKMKKICMMDDDLSFFYRPDPTKTKLLKSNPKQVEGMFSQVEEYLNHYIHVGVGQREYSNGVKHRFECVRAMLRILAYKPKEVLEAGCRFDRVGARQDLDMTLQLLRKGFPNAVTYDFVQAQASTNAPGGVSTYRTPEFVKQELKKLMDLHKGFMRIGKPKKRRGHVKGKDTEAWPTVTIDWKKAYQSSRKNKLLEEE